MEFSESLVLEIINKPASKFYITEENVKGKRTNKDVKIGKSFQYSSKVYENRFLIWNSDNNILTLTEHSTDFELLGNHIEIEFQKSQVLSVNVFETENEIHFLVATSLMVMRFSLHHPKKLRQPNSSNFNYSIFYGINDLNEIKHCVTPYFNANEITSVNCIMDCNENNEAYYNYALSNGSIFTFLVQESFLPELLSHFEMKEGSFFSKIISGILPRQRSNEYSDISIIDMAYVNVADQLYLATVSRDNKLKMWSLKDRYCVASEDLLIPVLEANNSNRSLSTIHFNSIISSHKIKSFLYSPIRDLSNTVLVYFHVSCGKMNLSNWIMVQLMNPFDRTESRQPIQIRANINSPGHHLSLIDFEIGYDFRKRDRIGVWSLFSDSSSETNSSHSMNWISLVDEEESERLSCRICNEFNEFDVNIENHQDPQEAIINKIFTPATISRLAIINTINKYVESDMAVFIDLSINELKQNLAIIVGEKIEKEMISFIEDKAGVDVLELNRKHWFQMLREIAEEHNLLLEPLGIISVAGTVGLVRYGTLSLMRYPNELEQIISTTTVTENLFNFYDKNSIVSGCTLLRLLSKFSQDIQATEVWSSMEYQIFQLGVSPSEITKHFLSMCSEIPPMINTRLDNQPEIIENTVNVLETLDIFENFYEIDSTMDSYRMSSFSIGMLHYSTCQMVRDRICISIAMITLLVPRIVNSAHSEHLQELVKRLERLVKSLVSIYWLLTLRQASSPELTDLQKTQLECLNLLENRSPDNNRSDILCLRVLQAVQNKSKVMHNHVNRSWPSKMTEEMLTLINFLHPNSETFSLYRICKYFLSYNMPLELINYLKFLQTDEPKGWWSGDDAFVNIATALAYLLLNNPWKAVDCITDAVCKEKIKPSLLPSIIFNDDFIIPMTSLPMLQANLILKFIDVMENTTNSQPYLITLAESGIRVIEESDSEDSELVKCKSVLVTILFKNLLEIGRFEEARLAIMKNPDKDKQKDCLRQFIIVLSEQNELNLLVQFSYECLGDEFVSIIQSRARTTDINYINNSFYYVLYSYHVKNNDLKAAAQCMLELALRLDEDLKIQGIYMTNETALKHLQMQAKSYLTCINVTSLLPLDDQLFVFPAALASSYVTDDKNCPRQNHPTTTKDQSDCQMDISGESVDMEQGIERVIINLRQIEQQYNLIRCRLKLLRESPENGFIQNGKLTKSLTLTSLLQMGLYGDAIKLCQDFGLGLEPVVSTIATRCVQVLKHCLDRPLLKERENIIDTLEEIHEKVDFASFGSLQKLMFKFLEVVLARYDVSPNGDLCIKACSKLLNGGMKCLPPWLIDMVNNAKGASGSLLRLYISNGYLEPAAFLAVRVLDEQIAAFSMLDEFNLRSLKSHSKAQVKWVSYPAIFSLLDIANNMVKQNCAGASEIMEKLEKKIQVMINILNKNPYFPAIQSI